MCVICVLYLTVVTLSPGKNPYAVKIIKLMIIKKKGKTNPITCHGGPQGCEMSRLPHFLDNRLTDGGGVVSCSLTPPKKIPGIYFY
jgi:hypothetical protein